MRTTLFNRVFIFSSVPYGLFWAVTGVLRGKPAGSAIAVGIALGVVFGLTMAAVIPAMHRWGLRRRGFDPESGDSGVDVRERITLPLTSHQALALCRSAVEQVPKASDVRVDAASATLEARVNGTWASWGERIECRVTPADGATEVSIRSRPALRTTIVDYGKNRENVERIRAFLARQGTPDLARQA